MSTLRNLNVSGGSWTFTFVVSISAQIRQKVISSAYIRALKDPFPPARQAGILAMAATHGYFTLAESAHRLLPSLCALTTDPDKGVRDQVSIFLHCVFCRSNAAV